MSAERKGYPTGSVIYLRMPSSLKLAVEKAAGAKGMSVNCFAMRALEGALQAQRNVDAARAANTSAMGILIASDTVKIPHRSTSCST